ncbi:hypothetical protein B0H13DRAFT_674904 [Mycena leptocephala]|nr:hypothetical protein B0H13DRAFT_674904 [Mycena leptocephala]
MPRGRGDQQPMRSAHTSASLLSRGHASKRGGSYRTVGDSAPEPRVPVRRDLPSEPSQSDIVQAESLAEAPAELQTEQGRASVSLSANSTELPAAQAPTISAREELHPHWYIRAVIYLCAFLHTRHRVTFRAVALILVCLGFIFSMIAGDLVGAAAMPRTLKTVFSKLGMKDTFTINPICFQCHRIFEPDITPDTFCPGCDEEVFGAPSPGAPHSDSLR